MKRPREESFWKQWKYFKGDTAALADHFECSRVSIYNWLHEFEDEKEKRIKERVAEKSLDISSDIEKDPERPFSYFIKKQKESPNQPEVRECTIRIPYSALIIMASDCHFGSKYTDADLAELVKESSANLDNVYTFFVGDLVDYEGAGPPDIRTDQAFAHPNTTRAMAEAWIKEFYGSMLLMVTGCHDNWTYRYTGETFLERLKKYIQTNAVFHDSIMLNLQVGNVMYRGHVAHKAGKSTSSYNPGHGMFRELREDFTGDFVVGAHRHKPAITMFYVREICSLAVNCGTFKTIGYYANKNFLQQPLSIPAVYFDGNTKKMVPFLDFRDGLKYVKKINSDKHE